MTLKEQIAAHDRQIDGLIRAFEAEHRTVSALAASVVHHDNQMEANNKQIARILEIADKHQAQLENLSRQLEAYLRRLPRQ